MRRIGVFFLICCLLATFIGCGEKTPFQYTYIDVFDTVTTLALYEDDKTKADALAAEIREAGAQLLERKKHYKNSRADNQRKTRELMERQAKLEAEIDALYPIPKRIRKEAGNEI